MSFNIKYDVSHGIFIDAVYQVEEAPFYLEFLEHIYHVKVLDFVKCFSASSMMT